MGEDPTETGHWVRSTWDSAEAVHLELAGLAARRSVLGKRPVYKII